MECVCHETGRNRNKSHIQETLNFSMGAVSSTGSQKIKTNNSKEIYIHDKNDVMCHMSPVMRHMSCVMCFCLRDQHI